MGKKDNPYGLTDQQIRFAEAYHKGGCTSAYKAALEAGYSENYANVSGHKLLGIVREYLIEVKGEIREKSLIEKQEILQLLKNALFLDPLDVFGEEMTSEDEETGINSSVFLPTLKDLRNVPKQIRQLITTIKPTRQGFEVQFIDKNRAIDTINRMLGYNEPEKTENNTTITHRFEDMTDDELREYIARAESSQDRATKAGTSS